ncbi:protein kinase [Pseudenhygromyxa sp. WMMC2535]|uniref:serine/threonine protein kinase n=1 Tax=Pseudenhygromyxa sp. WMMC2535 TaxID=2712867 RepID=UPI00155611C9|nr:serine/threonine-protein kinase [Pseudenhygromyxa sp. WMMC2535]NVB41697.1 protein kinase [Pseudenhygromyxa sp. WMMC2535]
MPSLAGHKLDKYDMLEEVGHGGMAVVYRGRDTILDREVAVKVLHTHLADREESRRRLQREAKTVAKLRHDNIVEIFDSSDPASGAESYIVCEFIHGVTLRDWLDERWSPRPALAAMIAHRLCLPLEHAHSMGIVHRDIKPENVMIRDDGCLKLMDFGIAQILDTQRLTTTGQLLGSPAYMAPELISGKPVDKRIDIFALGVMLYQLATNELPFSGRNPAQVLNRILEGDFKRPSLVDPKVDEDLEAIIAKALAREAADRYQSAKSLAADLEAYLAGLELEPSPAELAGYFGDPDTYLPKLDERVCRALTRRATQAMRAGNGARALKLLGRVLEIDPRDQRAAAMLDKVRARGQRMRQAAAVAGGLAAMGIIAAGVLLLRPDPPKPGSLESEDTMLAGPGGAYQHIPAQNPDRPPLPFGVADTEETETGEDEADGGSTTGFAGSAGAGQDEVGDGGRPSGGGRPPPEGALSFPCTLEIEGLPAAVLAGGDYRLSVAGTGKNLPARASVELEVAPRTRVSLVGESYEGAVILDQSSCSAGPVILRARSKPAVLSFQSAEIPLKELSVSCKKGCSVKDRRASNFPSLPFSRNETEMFVTLVFKAKSYREETQELRLTPGTNTVVVSLEKLE